MMSMRTRRRMSSHEKQEQYKSRLEDSKKRRKGHREYSIRRSMLGIIRYTNLSTKKVSFSSGISNSSLINLCSTYKIDYLDFNHATKVQGYNVFCFCFLDIINKQFYIRPVVIAEKKEENEDTDLFQLNLMNKSQQAYFESKGFKITVFDPIWLFDIVSHVFNQFEDIFFLEFKTRAGYRSFSTSTFFSRNSRGFNFNFSHRDIWCSSFQEDLKEILINLTKWCTVLAAVSEYEVWLRFKTFTSFLCSNITIWKKIINYCSITNQIDFIEEDSEEEKSLLYLLNSCSKDKSLKFRNSIHIISNSVSILGMNFSLLNRQKRANFLTTIKSLGLFKEYEEDAAFERLTEV